MPINADKAMHTLIHVYCERQKYRSPEMELWKYFANNIEGPQ